MLSKIPSEFQNDPEIHIRFNRDTMMPTCIFFYGQSEEETKRLQQVVNQLFPIVGESING
ncbi:MAG: hypothetical protein GX640_01335 [Fibrobacter sp.]|nr:hypothetical protein [Fibrobacter sp.]